MKISELPVLIDAFGGAYIPVVDPRETDPALRNKRIYLSTIASSVENFTPYDPAATYSKEQPDFVSYNNSIYEYIGLTPASGVLPTTTTHWTPASAGRFAHLQNTDTHTTSDEFKIGKRPLILPATEPGEPAPETAFETFLVLASPGDALMGAFRFKGVIGGDVAEAKIEYTNNYTGTGSDVWQDFGGIKQLEDALGNLINPDNQGKALLPDYVLANGSVFYHQKPYFLPLGTVSTSGTTVTAATDAQFVNVSQFFGSKIVINGEFRIVTAVTSNKILTVNAPFSQDYVDVPASDWRVYYRAFSVESDGSIVFFNHYGFKAKLDGLGFDSGVLSENGERLDEKYATIDYADGLVIPEQNTGTVLTFDKSRIYGTPTTAEDGLITFDLTGAQLGVCSTLYHNSDPAPTIAGLPIGDNSGVAKKMAGEYVPNVLNIFYLRHVAGVVEYTITQY